MTSWPNGRLIEQQTMPTRGKSDRRCYTTSWDTIVVAWVVA